MFEYDDEIEYMDFSEEGFREVQQCLDCFVEVNYETALGMLYRMKPTPEDITLYRGKVLDIIRHNPPLESVPRYFRDGREDYLWYSDFYDDITKEAYQRYRTFVASQVEITTANYTEELSKIDLPYFRELIDLVSLEKLCMLYEVNQPLQKEETDMEEETDIAPDGDSGIETIVDIPQKTEVDEQTELTQPARQPKKRSYEPTLNSKQYRLLAECVEEIKLFRRKVKIGELKKLLKGKLTEPMEVANQKSLVYLLDQLSENKYIKDTWISVADGNRDFLSFRTEGNKQRYGNNPHYITMQQLLNCRNRNKRESIFGLVEIEEMIDLVEENRDN
ncbi:hypothetical protein M2137_001791 [Parabacteroides sp. PFB2-10]|uniref:hypothetical protein n=1 Tax=Parabacteroides sp. PFB2-10 TaxID=1742405 RepID=UPI00247464C9|nr:hypothetical protein [Parabacteroides sp. PFB2-10]MDH6313004.1 hypothetical protein [Parabacteroides sp. PFB2-10]